MSRKIEALLRVIADMEKFEKNDQFSTQIDGSDELTLEELDLVAAAALDPMFFDKLASDK